MGVNPSQMSKMCILYKIDICCVEAVGKKTNGFAHSCTGVCLHALVQHAHGKWTSSPRWRILTKMSSEKQGNALYIDDSLYPLPQVPPHVATNTTKKQKLLHFSRWPTITGLKLEFAASLWVSSPPLSAQGSWDWFLPCSGMPEAGFPLVSGMFDSSGVWFSSPTAASDLGQKSLSSGALQFNVHEWHSWDKGNNLFFPKSSPAVPNATHTWCNLHCCLINPKEGQRLFYFIISLQIGSAKALNCLRFQGQPLNFTRYCRKKKSQGWKSIQKDTSIDTETYQQAQVRHVFSCGIFSMGTFHSSSFLPLFSGKKMPIIIDSSSVFMIFTIFGSCPTWSSCTLISPELHTSTLFAHPMVAKTHDKQRISWEQICCFSTQIRVRCEEGTRNLESWHIEWNSHQPIESTLSS